MIPNDNENNGNQSGQASTNPQSGVSPQVKPRILDLAGSTVPGLKSSIEATEAHSSHGELQLKDEWHEGGRFLQGS